MWLIGFYTERSEDTAKFLEEWSSNGALLLDVERKLPASTSDSCMEYESFADFVAGEFDANEEAANTIIDTTNIKLGLVNMYY